MADIFGVEINDPPEGWTVLEVIVLCKAFNDGGQSSMFTRYSSGVGDFESLGMLVAAQRSLAREIEDAFIDDEDGDDEDGDAGT